MNETLITFSVQLHRTSDDDLGTELTEEPSSATTMTLQPAPARAQTYFWRLPLLFVVVAAGMTANALVMLSIRLEKKHRRLTNCYVFSLACNELICGLFVQCPLVVYYVVSSWPFGEFVCRFWVFVDYATAGVSLMHLILLAYDRYIAIVRPLEYSNPVRKRYVPYQICSIYIVGALMSLVPNVLYGSPASEVAVGTCQLDMPLWYGMMWLFGVDWVSIIAITCIYVRCAVGLHRHFLKVHAIKIDVSSLSAELVRPTNDVVLSSSKVEQSTGAAIFSTETAMTGGFSGIDGIDLSTSLAVVSFNENLRSPLQRITQNYKTTARVTGNSSSHIAVKKVKGRALANLAPEIRNAIVDRITCVA